jgi:hypothetical protein
MSDKFYNVDWNKIERAEDIVAILAAINFNFNESHPRLHLIDHLLDKENPLVTEQSKPTPELKLPKLKKLDENEGSDKVL